MISEIEILKYLNEHRVVFLDDTFIFLSASAYAVCAAVLCVTGLFGFLKAKGGISVCFYLWEVHS